MFHDLYTLIGKAPASTGKNVKFPGKHTYTRKHGTRDHGINMRTQTRRKAGLLTDDNGILMMIVLRHPLVLDTRFHGNCTYMRYMWYRGTMGQDLGSMCVCSIDSSRYVIVCVCDTQKVNCTRNRAVTRLPGG